MSRSSPPQAEGKHQRNSRRPRHIEGQVVGDRGRPTAVLAAVSTTRRDSASPAGTDNLLVIVWLRTLGDSQRLETKIAEGFPTLSLSERAVVLRMTERMGRVLDHQGRTTHAVPINPWAGTPPTIMGSSEVPSAVTSR
ncbi:hypothetical protein [Streptomyces sp. NPDC046862]|uniref:hypothetical protein n=1 Tax=Streptomyces sp. NPDC046862 TaxID=3154603 RepID=UPI003451FF9D